MRQLCCHPNLILVCQAFFILPPVNEPPPFQSQADEFEDPTLLMAGEGEKELGRARKAMGNPWIAEVMRYFFLLIVFLTSLGHRSNRGRWLDVTVAGILFTYIITCRFLTRALATEVLDFSDEADTPQPTCPVCKDRRSDFYFR